MLTSRKSIGIGQHEHLTRQVLDEDTGNPTELSSARKVDLGVIHATDLIAGPLDQDQIFKVTGQASGTGAASNQNALETSEVALL